MNYSLYVHFTQFMVGIYKKYVLHHSLLKIKFRVCRNIGELKFSYKNRNWLFWRRDHSSWAL